jgi:hypothetical protein
MRNRVARGLVAPNPGLPPMNAPRRPDVNSNHNSETPNTTETNGTNSDQENQPQPPPRQSNTAGGPTNQQHLVQQGILPPNVTTNPIQGRVDDSSSISEDGDFQGGADSITTTSRKRHACGDERADRIHEWVKTVLFKRIKFINNHNVFVRAMDLIEEEEGIQPGSDQDFRTRYKSTLMDSLNAKRGTCEQAVGKVVHSELPTMIVAFCHCGNF